VTERLEVLGSSVGRESEGCPETPTRTRALRDKERAGIWAGGGKTAELDMLHKAGPEVGAQAATSALAGPAGKRSGEEEAAPGFTHAPPIGRAQRASARE
jgi:hypothetical protein